MQNDSFQRTGVRCLEYARVDLTGGVRLDIRLIEPRRGVSNWSVDRDREKDDIEER